VNPIPAIVEIDKEQLLLDQVETLKYCLIEMSISSETLRRELTRCNKKLNRRRLRARKERERLEVTLQARVNTCANVWENVNNPRSAGRTILLLPPRPANHRI